MPKKEPLRDYYYTTEKLKKKLKKKIPYQQKSKFIRESIIKGLADK